MLIGYARVSTEKQNLFLQQDALKQAGCDKVFIDKISSVAKERPGFNDALNYIREGDTLVVWRLDRMGRSTKNLIEIVNKIKEKGCNFKSLTENIDTNTSMGKLIFHIFSALAEREHDIIKERTQAGLKAARARGRVGGRPEKCSDAQKQQMYTLWQDKSVKVSDILKSYGIKKATFYRYMKDKPKVVFSQVG